MRRVLLIGDMPHAVQGGGGLENLGEDACGGEHVLAAHAVSNAALGAGQHGLAAIQEAQHAPRIVHHHGIADGMPAGGHILPLLGGHGGTVVADAPAAIVQVRHHAVIAHRSHPPGEIVEFLPDAGGVHVEDHASIGPLPIGVGDEGVHLAVCGFDFHVLFLHERSSGRLFEGGAAGRGDFTL
ncbi:MAG: hypothetical protein O7E56_07610 [SAR324 cluster bacterium]|nr:hypothetical protein [SAR324 cluster bacterium]